MDHDTRAAVFDGTAEHYDEDTFHARVADALVEPLPDGPGLVLDGLGGAEQADPPERVRFVERDRLLARHSHSTTAFQSGFSGSRCP